MQTFIDKGIAVNLHHIQTILRACACVLCIAVCGNGLDSKIDEELDYDAQAIADIFYQLNGDPHNPRKKLNHTQGFCASGELVPLGANLKHYDIPILRAQSLPVQIRFSLGGGNTSDKTKPRGLALKIAGHTESWEMALLNTEINFAKNPQEFGRFFAMRIPKDGKLDTQQIAKTTKEVASFRNYETYMAQVPLTANVADTTYHSVHTFFFRDVAHREIPARFKFVPKAHKPQDAHNLGDRFLESNFKQRIAQKPIEYTMILVLANPDDDIADTTALWQGAHKEVEIATLRVSAYNGRDCDLDVFMPAVLPEGIGAPRDPLFDVRNAVYAITFGRRQ